MNGLIIGLREREFGVFFNSFLNFFGEIKIDLKTGNVQMENLEFITISKKKALMEIKRNINDFQNLKLFWTIIGIISTSILFNFCYTKIKKFIKRKRYRLEDL